MSLWPNVPSWNRRSGGPNGFHSDRAPHSSSSSNRMARIVSSVSASARACSARLVLERYHSENDDLDWEQLGYRQWSAGLSGFRVCRQALLARVAIQYHRHRPLAQCGQGSAAFIACPLRLGCRTEIGIDTALTVCLHCASLRWGRCAWPRDAYSPIA